MTNSQSTTVSKFLSLVGPLVAKNIDDRLACAKAFSALAEDERALSEAAQKSGVTDDAYFHRGRAEAFTEAAMALLAEGPAEGEANEEAGHAIDKIEDAPDFDGDRDARK